MKNGWKRKKQQYGAQAIEAASKKAKNKAADRKQFQEYQAVLGKNAPKTVEKFQELKYNKSEEWEAFNSYKRAVQTGELTPLADFKLYRKTSREIDEKLVGLTTSNGITITGKPSHFIARIIGSIEQRRSGVGVDKVLNALTSKDTEILPVKVSPSGKVSQRFILGDIELSINPENGNLIQANPYSRGRKS